MPFFCGSHRVMIYERGGQNFVTELTPVTQVRWRRIRDDVSDAQINIPTHDCCDELADLRTIEHEVHLIRNGLPVWEGPITRIEYDFDEVRLYAADVLWQSTRRALDEGYSHAFPNINNTIDTMAWLLNKCYGVDGDPWHVVPHIHPHYNPAGDPQNSRVVNAWQYYIWEDFDKYAEDYGTDYTVVNRDIHFNDIHLAWKVIPPLDEQYISQFPRIVEYGNQAATRGVVTNGYGYAGIATAPPSVIAELGTVDWLITNENDGQTTNVPTPEELNQWSLTAGRNIDERWPQPVAIVIPDNTTLLPGSPWLMEDLVPGAWFQASSTRLCRTVTEWQRIHEVVVTEAAPSGETVQFSAVTAPNEMDLP